MILELKGTKVTIVDKTLGYQGDNLVDTIQVTVDKDSTWNYKLDMYKGKSKRFDSVLMVREGNICTVQLTNEILSYGGRYVFQLRGYTDTQTYHSDIFESWVNASIEYQDDCKQTDCGCDCKLPTEFYQVEDNVTEINNHPPYPGDNNKWMIWDVDRHEYVESDIEVIGGGGGDYQTKDNLTTSITAESTDEQYPSAKATYDYGQSIAQSAGKINAITVNGTAQTVEDKTAKIIVNKSTVGLGNVNNTSDDDKPVSSAQASAIADAKQAGTTAQANLDAHISNKENPHEVTKVQVGLSDVDNTSDENKPVSILQATAIADAKKAGTDAQANLTTHINDKENPHEVTKAQVGLGDVDNTSDVNKPISTATQTALNGKLDKTAVVDVTVEALKGQAADAKSVYDAIQAAKPDIVTPTEESTDTQAASAKAVWDMLGGGGSGTDISLGITSASVGDIVKVKAVDANGKPTAWEAAQMLSGSGKAKSQILIDQEITELTASLSVTLEHNFHNITAIINCGSDGAVLTANSDGTAVVSKIGLLIDTTAFGFNSRKVAYTDTSTATWQTRMIGAEWSDDLSVFKRGFAVDIATGISSQYCFPFGGTSAMHGTLGTDDNTPRTGKTANIVVYRAYLNVGTRVVLWGEYYE